VQVVRDEAGDVHIYAKSIDDVLVHRKKDDSGKVASLLFMSAGNPANMTELVKVLFGIWTLEGPRNHVLDGGSDLFTGRGTLKGDILRCARWLI